MAMRKSQREAIERVVLQALRAIIYARVSTDKQEEEGTSLDVQVANGMEYAQAHNLTVVECLREVFTGSLYRQRPELTKLRQMARNREFDVIIINTFDRLSRNQTHLAVLIDEMEHLGIKIACIKENFDDTPAGQFMRNALGFVAEIERHKILDRSIEGKRKRVREGKMLRSWKPKYGYQWADATKENYVLVEHEAAVIRKIFILYTTRCMSLLAIANDLTSQGIPTPAGKKEWDKAVLNRILADPTYLGKAYAFRYDKHGEKPEEEWVKLPDGLIPPIVDEATFLKAQAQLERNKREAARNSKNAEDALLRCGFIKCGYCKRGMTVNHREYKRKTKESQFEVTYRCSYKYRKPGCPKSASIDIRKVDDRAWQYVGEIIRDFSLVEAAVALLREKGNPTEANLQSIDQSIQIAEANAEQLTADLSQRNPDGSYKLKGRSRERILDELQKVEEYLEELAAEKQKIQTGAFEWIQAEEEIDKFLAWALSARETYPTATYQEKRRALRMLGIEVYIYRADDKDHEQVEFKVTVPDLRDIALQIPLHLHYLLRRYHWALQRPLALGPLHDNLVGHRYSGQTLPEASNVLQESLFPLSFALV
jgi:site-specific DNA recombinase